MNNPSPEAKPELDAAVTASGEDVGQFQYGPQTEARSLVDELLGAFIKSCPASARLAERLTLETGTRPIDWVDTVFAHEGRGDLIDRLKRAGFEPFEAQLAADVTGGWHHPDAKLPMIATLGEPMLNVGLRVDSVADFMAAQQVPIDEHTIGGEPGERSRWAPVFEGNDSELWAIERHGYRGMAETNDDPMTRVAASKHLERFRTRRRDFGLGDAADAAGFDETERLIDAAVEEIGRDWACDLFFASERAFWLRRCRAGRIQKARQDRLGLGWANHDHHVYRCGRRGFARTVSLLERLGLFCRERWHAGSGAQWGAQVLEQPVTGTVVLAAVDLDEDECARGFAAEPLAEAPEGEALGPVGLWVGLHGESFLQAGAHAVCLSVDHDAAVEQFETEHEIRSEAIGSAHEWAKHSMTVAESWPVEAARLDALVNAGRLSNQQAEQIRVGGAGGSRLGLVERLAGFRGLNFAAQADAFPTTS